MKFIQYLPAGIMYAPVLPEVGEVVEVEDHGKATVKRLYHTTHQNYIELTFEDVLTEEKTYSFKFEALTT
jgi:hypothetical protein